MKNAERVHLRVERDAPHKPVLGAPCNGCGVCCLAEPCPIGALVSGRRTGACAALLWSAPEKKYRCGLLVAPEAHAPRVLAPLVRRLARRMISAGTGCDSDVEIAPGE